MTLGFEHACAIFKGGTVRCDGENFRGQLGNGRYDVRYREIKTHRRLGSGGD